MTRRIFTVVLLVYCLAAPLGAVDYSAGARAGISGSLLAGSYAENLSGWLSGLGAGAVSPKPLVSWQFGIAARMTFSPFFSAQTEFTLGPVGGGLRASDGYDLLVGVSALEATIPFLAMLHLQTRAGMISLFAGPCASILLGDPLFIQNNGTIRSESALTGMSVTLGASAGSTFEIPLGPGSLLVDLRAGMRFLSVIDTGPERTSLTPVSAVLCAGYMVPITALTGKDR